MILEENFIIERVVITGVKPMQNLGSLCLSFKRLSYTVFHRMKKLGEKRKRYARKKHLKYQTARSKHLMLLKYLCFLMMAQEELLSRLDEILLSKSLQKRF